MLLLTCSIISIVNGLVLDIPINFSRPNWMNNYSDSLETFFITNQNESYINGNKQHNCVVFKPSKISYDNIAFKSKCRSYLGDVNCKMPTFLPSKYCPLSGSLRQIVIYLNDTVDEALYIVAKGCYLNTGDETVEGDWYISNKKITGLENFNELQTDFLNISDPNIMKCSVLCNGFNCEGTSKIEFGLRFHSEKVEKVEIKKYDILAIASIGGGILVLVVFVVIIFFVKKFKNK